MPLVGCAGPKPTMRSDLPVSTLGPANPTAHGEITGAVASVREPEKTAAVPKPTMRSDLPTSTPGTAAHGETTGAVAPVREPGKTAAVPPYWPTQGWRISTPEEQGVDAAKLALMLDSVQQEKLNLYSLLVIRNGHIVSETYFGSTTPDTRREIYSVTKSFIGTLVGIAIDKGLIAGVDRPVAGFFPDRSFANWDAAKQAMTLENLLTMTTGLDWPEADATFRQLYGSRDWVKFVLDEPMRGQPGAEFLYCSGCSHVLSAIIQRQTGMNTRDFAQQELFVPLGIGEFNWETDSTGIPIGGWGLQLTPREMAKLGYLYLHGGQWDGRQIVSGEWVEAATRKHTATDSDLGYGYQWWTYPKWGAYAALGRYGQTIFVIPNLKLIVVTTAALEGHDPIFDLIDQYIVPAVEPS
jgi:CubicO group peptidase (beta-lactamase class C family)